MGHRGLEGVTRKETGQNRNKKYDLFALLEREKGLYE